MIINNLKKSINNFQDLTEQDLQTNGGTIWKIPTALTGYASAIVTAGKIVNAGYQAGKWIGEQAYKK